jgi:hypothetical protein
MRPIPPVCCPSDPRRMKAEAKIAYREFLDSARIRQMDGSRFLELPEVQEIHRQSEDSIKTITNARKSNQER